METIRDAFVRARDYKKSWDDFRAKKTKIAPRKDLELEPLVEILEAFDDLGNPGANTIVVFGEPVPRRLASSSQRGFGHAGDDGWLGAQG